MDQLMGTIFAFAPNWAPKGFMPCDGRLLSVSQYSALFSLLGTQYGGNGVSTFGLPNIPPINTAGQATILVVIAVQGVYPSRSQ